MGVASKTFYDSTNMNLERGKLLLHFEPVRLVGSEEEIT